VGIIF